MRVLLYAKLLKVTKIEETIVFLVTFLSLVAFQLGGGARAPLLATLILSMAVLTQNFNLLMAE